MTHYTMVDDKTEAHDTKRKTRDAVQGERDDAAAAAGESEKRGAYLRGRPDFSSFLPSPDLSLFQSRLRLPKERREKRRKKKGKDRKFLNSVRDVNKRCVRPLKLPFVRFFL